MRRRLHIALIVVGVLLFLAVSAVLARVFSADGAERSAIQSLLQAEARGEPQQMLALMRGCGSAITCRATVAQNAAQLKRAGQVTILKLDPSTGFSLTSTLGTARVVWNVGSSLPIVQCVRVRRAGDALSGLRIELLAIGPRIKTDGTCSSYVP